MVKVLVGFEASAMACWYPSMGEHENQDAVVTYDGGKPPDCLALRIASDQVPGSQGFVPSSPRQGSTVGFHQVERNSEVRWATTI